MRNDIYISSRESYEESDRASAYLIKEYIDVSTIHEIVIHREDGSEYHILGPEQIGEYLRRNS